MNNPMESEKWMRRWMDIASTFGSWSKDRSRKVGAVIVGPNRQIIGHGYNGFPRGLNDDVDKRHERPAKYMYTVHAEMNAILNALENEKSVRGCTIYTTLFPCTECARAIIQSGIACVVVKDPPNFEDPKYAQEFRASLEMFREVDMIVAILGEEQNEHLYHSKSFRRSHDLTGIDSEPSSGASESQ